MSPDNDTPKPLARSNEMAQAQANKKPVGSSAELDRDDRRKLTYSWLYRDDTPVANLAKVISREKGQAIFAFEVERAIKQEIRRRLSGDSNPGAVVPMRRMGRAA